ncbi:putative F-box protein At5g55150 [Fagus crenata]
MNWSAIPHDLVFEIAKRLSSYEDFVALCGVCKSWRMISTRENLRSPQDPWLMLADHKNNVGWLIMQRNPLDINLADPITRSCPNFTAILGDAVWTTINTPFSCRDAIFHKGQLYALYGIGSVLVCDIQGPKDMDDIY